MTPNIVQLIRHVFPVKHGFSRRVRPVSDGGVWNVSRTPEDDLG